MQLFSLGKVISDFSLFTQRRQNDRQSLKKTLTK